MSSKENPVSQNTWHSNRITTWFIATRVTVISVMLICGVLGNGYVLRFYGKNKRLTGQVYIITLAVVDLLACVLFLPQVPLFEVINDESWSILN